MKWSDMRRSSNVEDDRSGSGVPGGVGGASIGGVIIAVVVGLIFGVNPLQILSLMQGGDITPAPQRQAHPVQDKDSDFVKAVLGDTEDTWGRVFKQQLNATYQPPKLVLFSSSVDSACGFAKAAAGPFYCPSDDKVYLDMSFFRQIQATAGPDADFARAYAIAHEVGHHVQNQLGISTKVRQLQGRSDKATVNSLSVRLELQADCFAGIWGHYTAERNLINGQDVTAAMNTATQIGDDYLQKQSRGYVVPEAFTHGSSQQRVSWFTRGLKSGNLKQCDTFSASQS